MSRGFAARMKALESQHVAKVRPMTAFVIWKRTHEEAKKALARAIEAGDVKRGNPVILGSGQFCEMPAPRWTDALGMSDEELEMLSTGPAKCGALAGDVLGMTDAELSNSIIREAARPA